MPNAGSLSWYEASARQRIDALLDIGSFHEFIGAEQRQTSPHLAIFDLPAQFDDGIVVGRGRLGGSPVLLAAQEGRFMGGAFGEVHGAKLTGLLRAARKLRANVLILFDTGGVRLQEANAGELAIAEIMRAVMEARRAGVDVIGLIGGRAGCYGGGSLIAGTCSRLIVSEQGRISVSGPEVIETNKGIEEFDSRDRALVWRTMGGKHRYLIGGADMFVDDEALAFRQAAIEAFQVQRGCDVVVLEAEQQRLERRLNRFGHAKDAVDIWQVIGIDKPAETPGLPAGEFLRRATDKRENADDAR
jgi:malonate decarboxylase beta subunit